ncbi:hypothetical protein NEHOM01_2100 [Nematocida homosporus]|uniref:uncharacterized protein n=1 Tax=Nematocida homosporus TaxID=1912981 RepID=UPI00221E75CB|nr:uncharacterized protein NEHOM01_2100 [Nematocida homosporus]KAI5187333.1 hypothetical protein NEHOM01_2100 [Nematocida homosporus]
MLKLNLTMKDIEQLIQYKQGDSSRPVGLSKLQWQRLQRNAERFLLYNNKLYYVACSTEGKNLLEVIGNDDSVRLKSLVQAQHIKEKHASTKNVYRFLRKQYMGFTRQTILRIATDCSRCNKPPPPKQTIPLLDIEDVPPRMHLLIDFIDMRYCAEANDGYGWILTTIDVYSKYLVAMKMKRKTGKAVVKQLQQQFAVFGCPWIVKSNNDPGFVNVGVIAFMKEFDIEYRHDSPRPPQSQGKVECVNQSIIQGLFKDRSSDNPDRWIDQLNDVVRSYNEQWHQAINNTPIDVCYGWPMTNGRPLQDEECQMVYD